MKEFFIRLLGGYTNEDFVEGMKEENRQATYDAYREIESCMKLLYPQNDGLWRHNAWQYVENKLKGLEGRM